MKIEVNEDGNLVLKEVYNSVSLETNSGEVIHICMRDSGFEFKYEGKWYEAKHGFVIERGSKNIIDNNKSGDTYKDYEKKKK